MCVPGALGIQNMASYLLELEFQVVVSHLTWLLRIEFMSSARIICTLMYWAIISSTPIFFITIAIRPIGKKRKTNLRNAVGKYRFQWYPRFYDYFGLRTTDWHILRFLLIVHCKVYVIWLCWCSLFSAFWRQRQDGLLKSPAQPQLRETQQQKEKYRFYKYWQIFIRTFII